MIKRNVAFACLILVPIVCTARPNFPLEQLCNFVLTEVQKEVAPKLASYTHREYFFVAKHDNSLSPIMNEVDWIKDLWIQGRYADSGMFGVKAVIFMYDAQNSPSWTASIPSPNFSMKVFGGLWPGGPAQQKERTLRIGVICSNVDLSDHLVSWIESASYKERIESYVAKDLAEYTKEWNGDLNKIMQIEEIVD
jgi:hypothetical protein